MGLERNPVGPNTSPIIKFSPCGTVTEPLKLPVALRVPPAIISSIAKCTPIGENRPTSPLKAYKDGPFEKTYINQTMQNEWKLYAKLTLLEKLVRILNMLNASISRKIDIKSQEYTVVYSKSQSVGYNNVKNRKKCEIRTSYPAPIRITPKSRTDALGRVSENSCLRIASADCKKFHLQMFI